MSASALMISMVVAGGAMQAIGQIRQGKAMETAAKYNALVAEAEGRAITTAGEFERGALTQQSKVEQAKIAREKAAMTSEQRARYAKAGVRIDVGSPLEVMAESAANFELDLAAERYNLAIGKERIGYETRVGVARTKSEAAYQRLLGKQYRRAGYYGAGATLLTTAGTAAYMGGTRALKTTPTAQATAARMGRPGTGYIR